MGSLTGAVALRRYSVTLDRSCRGISRGAFLLYAGTSEYGIILVKASKN